MSGHVDASSLFHIASLKDNLKTSFVEPPPSWIEDTSAPTQRYLDSLLKVTTSLVFMTP